MQRQYQKWRDSAVEAQTPLTAEDRQKFEATLLQGLPVVIHDTLLVPDSDTAFVTAANPEGRFIHGQNHLGYVIAAADSINSKGIAEAIQWAEIQKDAPEGDGHGPFTAHSHPARYQQD